MKIGIRIKQEGQKGKFMITFRCLALSSLETLAFSFMFEKWKESTGGDDDEEEAGEERVISKENQGQFGLFLDSLSLIFPSLPPFLSLSDFYATRKTKERK